MTFADIHWVALPDRGGREQRGRRPAVFWQNLNGDPSPTVLLIPITSNLSALRFPGTHRILRSNSNGLSLDSVALVFQLGATDVPRTGARVGRLDDADLTMIQRIAKDIGNLR